MCPSLAMNESTFFSRGLKLLSSSELERWSVVADLKRSKRETERLRDLNDFLEKESVDDREANKCGRRSFYTLIITKFLYVMLKNLPLWYWNLLSKYLRKRIVNAH